MNTMTAKASYIAPESVEIALSPESLMTAVSYVGTDETSITTSETNDGEFRSRRRAWSSENWTSQGEE